MLSENQFVNLIYDDFHSSEYVLSLFLVFAGAQIVRQRLELLCQCLELLGLGHRTVELYHEGYKRRIGCLL
jgi:hypothetical protein